MTEAEHVRLFVALELPETIRQALIGWGVQALRGTDGIRLLATEGLHVTLCFLGWRSLEDVGPIEAGCAVLHGIDNREHDGLEAAPLGAVEVTNLVELVVA